MFCLLFFFSDPDRKVLLRSAARKQTIGGEVVAVGTGCFLSHHEALFSG